MKILLEKKNCHILPESIYQFSIAKEQLPLYTLFFIKCSEYDSHTDISHKRKKNVQFRGLQILTSLVTFPVLWVDSCSAEVGGGRSVPPVAIIISTVGGGNVADCPDEVGWGNGPKKDKTLNHWSWGKQIILFPENLNISRGTSLDLFNNWKFWSWKFIKPPCNGGGRSTFAGNSALLPSDVLAFAMLPAQKFWWERETASLLDVM